MMLRQKIPPEKGVASVRSFISLRLMRSSDNVSEANGSQAGQTGGASGKRARERYDVSHTGNSQWENLPESPCRIVPSSSAGKESWAVSEDSTVWSTSFEMLGDAIELGHKISQNREMCGMLCRRAMKVFNT